MLLIDEKFKNHGELMNPSEYFSVFDKPGENIFDIIVPCGTRLLPEVVNDEAEVRALAETLARFGIGTPEQNLAIALHGALLGPLGYAEFSTEQQRLATLYLVYIVLVDDLVERDPQWRHCDEKDGDLAVLFAQDMYGNWKRGDINNSPVTKLGAFILDSLSRMADERFMRRLSDSMSAAINDGVLPMQHWAAHGTLPSVEDYCRVRVSDFYIFTMLDLIRAYVGCDHDSQNMKRLTELTGLYLAIINDICSYHKEVVVHGRTSNYVRVLQGQNKWTLSETLQACAQTLNRLAGEILEVEACLLGEAGPDHPAVNRFVAAAKGYTAGITSWFFSSGRYDAPMGGLQNRLKLVHFSSDQSKR